MSSLPLRPARCCRKKSAPSGVRTTWRDLPDLDLRMPVVHHEPRQLAITASGLERRTDQRPKFEIAEEALRFADTLDAPPFGFDQPKLPQLRKPVTATAAQPDRAYGRRLGQGRCWCIRELGLEPVRRR